MSISTVAPYVGLGEFKDVVGHVQDQYDPELQLALSEGAGMIDDYCGRSFHAVTETRPFDAPPSEWLLVGDLLAVTTLTAFDSILTGSDYLFLPDRKASDYDALLRVYGTPSWAVRWDRDPATGDPLGLPWRAISIAGVWGYAATWDGSVWVEQIPAKVARANILLSARLWQMRTVHYTGDGGGTQIGRMPQAPSLMSDEVKDLLNPYMRSPLPIYVGSPYGD